LFRDAKVDGVTLLRLSEWDIGEVIGVKDPVARAKLYNTIDALRSLEHESGSTPPVVSKASEENLPEVIQFYHTGTSFKESPAHQISRVEMETKLRTLDDVKLWLGNKVGEAVEKFKGREGFDIADISILKSLGQAYFLRKDEFYFLPIEKIGGNMEIFIPSLKRKLTVEMLSKTPRLLLVKNFISKQECDAIINTAKPRLQHSSVAVVKNNQQASEAENQIRTSSTAWLDSRSTGLTLLDDITRRVYELVQVPMNHAEDMQVLHYGFKQHYHAHHDFFDPKVYPTEEYKKGHNRMITVFMYLSDVEEGGETNFPYATGDTQLRSYDKCEMGLKVKPKLGDCIVFYSMKSEAHRPDGNQLDHNSLHAGCDVIKGDKWSANYWIRNVPWKQR
jgi:prolyl 4-hydroxylase